MEAPGRSLILGGLPGRKFKREWLVLALVALTVFAPMHGSDAQDESRLALTHALVVNGTTRIDRWSDTKDRATYNGHFYTDKAPGLSLLAIPAYGIERAVGGLGSPWEGRWSRWLMRVLVNGPLLILVGLLVGRRAEWLARGSGALLAVAVTLGTMLGALSSVLFSHVGAAAFGFAAFAAAPRDKRRPVLAGTLAGAAVLIEYQSAIVLVVVACLVAVGGLRQIGWYVAGALPPLVLLGAYDWVSFGSPAHLSYRYVDNTYAAEQSSGFFGIGTPSLSSLRAVLLGGSGVHLGSGILVTSPLLVGSLAGAILLWRRGLRREVIAITAICIAYLIYNAGYFLPYGGISPGPRFLAPALPFAVLPLAACYARWRLATVLLVVLSVALSTDVMLGWFLNNNWVLQKLPRTIWSEAGLGCTIGVVLVFATAALALLAAVLPLSRNAA
jgi:hypothetical protein